VAAPGGATIGGATPDGAGPVAVGMNGVAPGGSGDPSGPIGTPPGPISSPPGPITAGTAPTVTDAPGWRVAVGPFEAPRTAPPATAPSSPATIATWGTSAAGARAPPARTRRTGTAARMPIPSPSSTGGMGVSRLTIRSSSEHRRASAATRSHEDTVQRRRRPTSRCLLTLHERNRSVPDDHKDRLGSSREIHVDAPDWRAYSRAHARCLREDAKPCSRSTPEVRLASNGAEVGGGDRDGIGPRPG
jgi:hypothetical protein